MSNLELVVPNQVELHKDEPDELSIGKKYVDGRYAILGALKAGGQHKVYKAQDELSDMQVALKVFYETNEYLQNSVNNEIEANISLFGEPGITEMIDFGIIEETDQPQRFMTQRLGDIDCKTLVNNYQMISTDALLMGALDIAQGLSSIKQAGWVDKDVKPENVIVDFANNRLSIIDLGSIVKYKTQENKNFVDDSVSANEATHLFYGTRGYSAPEIIRNKQITPASDVFSYGATIYELATGTKPFNGDDFKEYVDEIENTKPLPIKAFNDEIPDLINHIILSSLERQPEKGHDIEEVEAIIRSIIKSRGIRRSSLELAY